MATSIEVNKNSVKEFLATGEKYKFLIPEYQRPYSWDEEQITTLFNDLVEFTKHNGKDKPKGTYFLGSIVAYYNEDKEQEIIDGQQRITTLFLLLRAIYAKLESMSDTLEKTNFMLQISSTIWEKDELTSKANMDSLLINSTVIEEDHAEAFKHILKYGKVIENSTDRYSSNYQLLATLLDAYSAKDRHF